MVVDRPRFRISPLVILLIISLVLVLIVTFFISIQPVSAPTDLSGAQAKLFDAGHGLDIFLIEYAKTVPNGNSQAKDALSQAKAAFETAKPSLATVDEVTANQVSADFATLEQKYMANADPAEITSLTRSIRERLSTLAKSLQAR
jgi:hypothetical protein